MLTLYSFWRSSASYRVRIALGLKSLPYDYIAVNLARGAGEQFEAAYRAVNPQSRVPALQSDGHVLLQSIAILEWLEEAHPVPPLLPEGSFARARVRSLAQLIAADIQPLQNTSVTKYLRETLGADDDAVGAWLREWIGRGLTAFEARLASEDGTGLFCHGDSPTHADCCLVPQCYAARRFGVDPAGFPTIARVEAACLALEGFRAAAPELQPDAPA
jgi:maleylacetoacetate isomerase